MSGTYAELVLEDPAADHGEPVGHGDQRLAVEVAIPNQSLGQWDVSEWDVDDWSDGWEWHDLSDRVRGVEWTRGREGLEGRPETGEATIDLANLDGHLTAWNVATTFPHPDALYPGSLVRIGWWDPEAEVYEPGLTGLLRRAVDQSSENTDADLWITWELHETTALLSTIDTLEQNSQGGGETSDDRMDRLLAAAGWPFGTDYGAWASGLSTTTLIATTLAGNRLAEVYLTADSVFWDAFSDRYGRLATWSKLYSELWFYADGTTGVGLSEVAHDASGVVYYLPWASPPEFVVDTEQIINTVVASRVKPENDASAGTASAVDSASVRKYGRSSYKRTDLLVQDEVSLELFCAYTLIGRADNAIRPAEVELDANMDPACLEALTRLDLGRSVGLKRTHPRYGAEWDDVVFSCDVVGYTVRAVALAPGVMNIGATLNLIVKAAT